jgi:type II secretory pathway pseudopilin PulG
MTTPRLTENESGFTLVELLVAMTTGMIVIFAVTTFILIGLRHSTRVSDEVDANQQGRLAMSQIMEELHSSCIAPLLAPVQPESTATTLRLIHQRGSAVAPTPILSEISLEGENISESVFPLSSESEGWKFSGTASSTRQLSTHISPTGSNPGIFSYFAYSGGTISPSPLPVPLSLEDAKRTAQVKVELTAAASTPSSTDEANPIGVKDAALLRFSPAPYSESANNLPCQ